MKTLLLLWEAFDYSWLGVRNTFYDEITFRIELAVNRIFTEKHSLSAKAKDAGNAEDLMDP